ncbi:DUF2627 domain-containing protein [Aquibacillus rhizosphaerae]|uniref:DUF2627 domain-containing protein n=1 Tax=Aquibacillus rhizosphaerae TaxID=3051431 RepID=A0ABT7L6X2_9BACI|nr:DUF2627 domain-containing protein [Aquibacillus sp. LR5S19]MDL4841607.1 DUF2627 domain-containing protein [Aquibacillus sp. LR5S19]
MRLLALIIIVIPGLIAVLGVKLMRDALFGEFFFLFFHSIIQFIFGLFIFLAGLAFIGGFILHRDRKRNLTKGRFSRNRKD